MISGMTSVTLIVGELVGEDVGVIGEGVGFAEGEVDGAFVGPAEGENDGDFVGLSVGDAVGAGLGICFVNTYAICWQNKSLYSSSAASFRTIIVESVVVVELVELLSVLFPFAVAITTGTMMGLSSIPKSNTSASSPSQHSSPIPNCWQ